MTAINSFKTICGYLPADIKNIIMRIDRQTVESITEIRLYCGRAVAVCSRDSRKFLTYKGNLADKSTDNALKVMPAHMKHIVSSLSRYSFHSHESELTDGWFVLENGVRAGLCGLFSNSGKGIIRDALSVNFRIAREVKGCADGIADRCFGRNILICGAVNSGKTTLLRDLCRHYGNRTVCTLVDQRCEISAVQNGIPMYDVGALTDVIIGRNRHDSIIGAVRTMSPHYIFCDEIANESDSEAIAVGIGCGTKFAATIHADSRTELMKRKFAAELIRSGAFDVAVLLGSTGVREIIQL